MSTNLYDVLGISRNATPEDVRRAYRRKALETHPDRLPQGVSAADKATSEDLFRRVNNAYEVLSDPQSRTAYDQHGIWPPPTSRTPYANGPDPFSDSFFRDPFVNHPFFRAAPADPFVGGFGFGAPRYRPGTSSFTDPFVLFNSIFGDLHRAFESDPFFDPSLTSGRRAGFGSSPFGGSVGFPSVMPSPFDFGAGSSRMQAFGSNGSGNGPRWVSQSWTSATVNGVTHTKSVHKDSQGNEHVLYRYPDGTERRTMNGVQQSSTSQPLRALPPSNPYPTQVDTSPPPPPYSEVPGQQPYRSRSSRHVHYDDQFRDPHSGEYGARDKDRERAREHGHRDNGQGQNAQGGAGWGSWRS